MSHRFLDEEGVPESRFDNGSDELMRGAREPELPDELTHLHLVQPTKLDRQADVLPLQAVQFKARAPFEIAGAIGAHDQ